MPIPGVGGALGAASGACQFTYQDLKEKYADFSHPRVEVLLGDTPFDSKGTGMAVSDIHVELSSGYEASMASFRLYDSYDVFTGKFFYDKVKKQVQMGNSTEIRLGYLDHMETVFVGFVSGVEFGFEPGGLPYIEIEAMDVKGLMMGGAYANALKATTYSAAVEEILNRTGQGRFKQLGGIKGTDIKKTPDAESGDGGMAGGAASKSSPITVEMVGESDYEFVVRAAKRYNYEFFVDRGKVLFRPAKSDTSTLIKMGTRSGLRGFHIQYSITGVVGKIEARAMDPGKAKVVQAEDYLNNTISTGGKAKQLVGKGAKVYLDASITSKKEAEARVSSLMEQMSYRLGSLEGECVGIPDLVPGRFIEVSGLGVPVDNRFYLTGVTHDFNSDRGFCTHIKGCAAQIKTTPAGGQTPAVGGGSAASPAVGGGGTAAPARAISGAAGPASRTGAVTGGAERFAEEAGGWTSQAGGIAAMTGVGAAAAAPAITAITGMAGGLKDQQEDT